ncbi:SH3 domain-containing protein [Muricauda sp. SCSIO 64092]|uniref:SH3 domain-containing protein n=1 Tax=Allomuricauda sp. SCSIO 64092 TaxID=2908842 RepID=UPI001FF57241|nr:SH3 domain-containing protein [Muricauda sp. SCSIO 64092]UOY07777.1 SH3 domain-containing protein [Muricauda sp. SCSIO 64092]
MTKQKHIFILLILFLTFKGYCQSKIGIIKDKDGFTNIRSDKSNKSEVIGKIFDKEHFTFFENDDSNWWIIETENGQIGYLHKSRVSFVKNGYVQNGKLTNKNVSLSAKDEHFKEVIIKFIQLKPTEEFYDFSCRGLIRTIKANKLIDEINYGNIDPVGSDFGLTFSKNQNRESLFIASKFGDYYGEILIIDENGKIQNFQGGQYFVTENGKYLVSDWSSDLSGLTIYDLEKKQLRFNNELDFYLGHWYFENGVYFSPIWNGEKEIDETYEIDFNRFSLKKSTMKIETGNKIEMTNQNCECK